MREWQSEIDKDERVMPTLFDIRAVQLGGQASTRRTVISSDALEASDRG